MSELAPQTPKPSDIRRLHEERGLYMVPEAAAANAALTEHHVDDLETMSDVIPVVPAAPATGHRRATREAGPPRHVEVHVEENNNVVHLPVRRQESVEVTAEDRRKAALATSGRTHRRATSPAGPSPYSADKSEPTPYEVTYKNGVKHLYMVDEQGKKRHLSYGGILEAYGHAGDMQGKPSLEKLQTIETDSELPSVKLDDEQEAQLERAIQTGDRSLLPVELTDAEWEAATGLKTESVGTDDPAPVEPNTDTTPQTAEPTTPEYQPKHRDELSTLMPMKKSSMFIWDSFTPTQRENWLKAQKAPRGYDKDLWESLEPLQRARVLDARVRHNRIAKVLSVIGIDRQFERNEDTSIRREVKLSPRRLVASALIGALAITGIASGAKNTAQHREKAPARSSTFEGTSQNSINAQADHQPTKAENLPKAGDIEALNFEFHAGDRPWNVMHRAGIADPQIMDKLDSAVKKSGYTYKWHGSGKHRWLEVDGKSDTESVINLLKPFIKK